MLSINDIPPEKAASALPHCRHQLFSIQTEEVLRRLEKVRLLECKNDAHFT